MPVGRTGRPVDPPDNHTTDRPIVPLHERSSTPLPGRVAARHWYLCFDAGRATAQQGRSVCGQSARVAATRAAGAGARDTTISWWASPARPDAFRAGAAARAAAARAATTRAAGAGARETSAASAAKQVRERLQRHRRSERVRWRAEHVQPERAREAWSVYEHEHNNQSAGVPPERAHRRSARPGVGLALGVLAGTLVGA